MVKTDRGNSAYSREERCAAFLTSPSPISISPLLLAFVTVPLLARAAAAASGARGMVLLGAESTGAGNYGFCWVLGGQDCPANMRQTVFKTKLVLQVRSVVLL